MVQRNVSPDDWLTPEEAAKIISINSGKQVSVDYMRNLIRQGRIKPYKITSRLNLYRRGDVEKIKVGERGRRPDSVRMKEKEKMQDADNAA